MVNISYQFDLKNYSRMNELIKKNTSSSFIRFIIASLLIVLIVLIVYGVIFVLVINGLISFSEEWLQYIKIAVLFVIVMIAYYTFTPNTNRKKLKENAMKDQTENWKFTDNEIYFSSVDFEFHETWSNLKSIKKFSDGYLISFNGFISFLPITKFSNVNQLEFEKMAGNKLKIKNLKPRTKKIISTKLFTLNKKFIKKILMIVTITIIIGLLGYFANYLLTKSDVDFDFKTGNVFYHGEPVSFNSPNFDNSGLTDIQYSTAIKNITNSNFNVTYITEYIKNQKNKIRTIANGLEDIRYISLSQKTKLNDGLLRDRDLNQVITSLNAWLVKNQSKLSDSEKAEYLHLLGLAHVINNSPEFYYWKNFRRALILNPENSQLILDIADTNLLLTIKPDIKAIIANYKKALNLELNTLGDDHPKVARYMVKLGNALNTFGSGVPSNDPYTLAFNYFETALKIDIKVYGEVNPIVAEDWENMANVRMNQEHRGRGYIEEAVTYYEKAITAITNNLEKPHPDISKYYSEIGYAWLLLGQDEKASEYLHKALKLNLKYFGERQPIVVDILSTLGNIYYDSGDYNQAIKYYERSIVIRIKVYGLVSYNAYRDWESLADAWDRKGDEMKYNYFNNRSTELYNAQIKNKTVKWLSIH